MCERIPYHYSVERVRGSLINRFADHGLLASDSRMRHAALRSQATMVRARRKSSLRSPARSQHHIEHRQSLHPSMHWRRIWQARSILALGHCSSNDSAEPMCSQACLRQCSVNCPDGVSQSGRKVKVVWQHRQIPRLTQIRSRIDHAPAELSDRGR